MKRLESCCCCCGVRTGALIVAGIWLVFDGFNILNSGLGFITMDLTMQEIDKVKDQAQASYYRDEITEQEYRQVSVRVDVFTSNVLLFRRIFVSVGDTVEAVLPWLFGAELTLSLIDLVVVILLLIGVVHKRHKYYFKD